MTSHRTVVLVGPSGSGKTDLVAALTGGPPRLGGPLSWSSVHHAGTTLHLLDAPGDPFLAGPLLAGLHTADIVLFVLSAGADARTVQLWERCEGRPRVVAVTGLDRPGADFDEAVALCQRLLGDQVHPLSLPLHGDGPDEAVEGVLDLLTQRLYDSSGGRRVERDPDPQHLPLIESLRSELVEAVLAEAPDENLLDAYLDADVVPANVVDLLHAAVAAGSLQPVMPVSPAAGVGLVELLDVLAASASFAPPVVRAADGSPAAPLTGAPDGPYVAQVLQVTPTGALVRVLSGSQVSPSATAGAMCVGSWSEAVPGSTRSDGDLVVDLWDVPEPQHPTAVHRSTVAGTQSSAAPGATSGPVVAAAPELGSDPLTALAGRVRLDRTARLTEQQQLVLWTLGPPHADLLLGGLDLLVDVLQVDDAARTAVRVEVPRAFARTVVSDLTGRGGVVLGRELDDDGGDEVVIADLPDRELLSYAVALATASQGTGTFTRPGR